MLDQHDKQASSDIKFLFTNVPIDYALEIIDNRWNEVEVRVTKICMEIFCIFK